MQKHLWNLILVGGLLAQGVVADEAQQEASPQPSEELKTFLKEIKAARPQNINRMFSLLSAEKSKQLCDEVVQFGGKFSDVPEVKDIGIARVEKISQHCAGIATN